MIGWLVNTLTSQPIRTRAPKSNIFDFMIRWPTFLTYEYQTCEEKVGVLDGDLDQVLPLRATPALYCGQENNTTPIINCTSKCPRKQ